jgi:hypothetical protein
VIATRGDAILADGRCVGRQPQLRGDRIDQQRPTLQSREAPRQLPIETLRPQEPPEYGEATATSQARVGRCDTDARRVWTPDLLSEVKVAVAALPPSASRRTLRMLVVVEVCILGRLRQRP